MKPEHEQSGHKLEQQTDQPEAIKQSKLTSSDSSKNNDKHRDGLNFELSERPNCQWPVKRKTIRGRRTTTRSKSVEQTDRFEELDRRPAAKLPVRRLFACRWLLWRSNWPIRFIGQLVVLLASLLVISSSKNLANCDDHQQQQANGSPRDPSNLFSSQELQSFLAQQHQQQHIQMDPKTTTGDEEIQTGDSSSSSLSYFSPDKLLGGASGDLQQGGPMDLATSSQQQQMSLLEAAGDLLESANSKTSTASDSSAASSSSPSADSKTTSSSSSSGTQATPSTASSVLGEQLNVVTNLIQQAGQLGLTAAQQNVALSEAIINGLTSSLVNRQRQQTKPADQQQVASSSTTTTNKQALVGQQGIQGDINYDSNQNAINGFIEFPSLSNLTSGLTGGNKPPLVKALLLAALKTVPIKLGSVGWKLLQMLAWKKIYKTHHPKSAEIIVEQEIGGGGGGKDDKLADLQAHFNGKMSKMMGGGGVGGMSTGKFDSNSKIKTSKMGTGWPMGAPDSDDQQLNSMMLMMGRNGGGWPHSAAASSPVAAVEPHPSMMYQRHLLPPHNAAAAAAAATAAAIQSHWVQQQMAAAAEEAGESRAANQTSPASALQRKKASFGGANWFAASPAHAYAAAAAAANTAAALASQHHHHHQAAAHRVGYASDPFGGPPEGHAPSHLHQALATGLMYQSLFDNAAAMAVQNAVKLPPPEPSVSPAGSSDYLDQSDSLLGSLEFGGPNFLQRRREMGHPDEGWPVGDTQAQVPVPPSAVEALTDFDDTPAGRLIGSAIAINETGQLPIYRLLHEPLSGLK